MVSGNEPTEITIDERARILAYFRVLDSEEEHEAFKYDAESYVYDSPQFTHIDTVLSRCGYGFVPRHDKVRVEFASGSAPLTKEARPELVELLVLAEGGTFDVLVLAELADLGRNVEDVVALLSRFKKAGVRVLYCDANNNPTEAL